MIKLPCTIKYTQLQIIQKKSCKKIPQLKNMNCHIMANKIKCHSVCKIQLPSCSNKHLL